MKTINISHCELRVDFAMTLSKNPIGAGENLPENSLQNIMEIISLSSGSFISQFNICQKFRALLFG